MKKLFIFLTILIIATPCFAYDYEIDHEEEACYAKNWTTAGMATCTVEATVKWENMMNKYYDLLVKKLPEEDKKLLIQSQKSWEKYKEDEIKLINSAIGGLQGTIHINISRGDIREIFKNRALALRSYYLTIYEP